MAWGIHDLVNEAAATRAHAAESGIDLRRFNLIAFGGAGIHAYAIAQAWHAPRLKELGAGVASCLAPPAIDLVSAYEGELDRLDCHWSLGNMILTGEAALGALVGGDTALSLQGICDARTRLFHHNIDWRKSGVRSADRNVADNTIQCAVRKNLRARTTGRLHFWWWR